VPRASGMTDLPSLRSRVTTGTTLLLMLVFVMTYVGVSEMNSLDDSVREELGTLRERTILTQTITHSVVTAVRTGDAMAALADSSAYARLDSAFATVRAASQEYSQSNPTTDERRALQRIATLATALERESPGQATADNAHRGIAADSLLLE